MQDVARFVAQLPDLAERTSRAGAVLSGDAAAHAHLAVVTGTTPNELRYAALPAHQVEAVFPAGSSSVRGVAEAAGPVVDVLRARLDLFTTELTLTDGTRVPVLTVDAVLAQLLARGGLALGLAGLLVRLCASSVDADEVREILKAARQGDRFQPLLELIDVA
jgi:hypothetical protein